MTSCSSAVLESMRVVPSLAEALADCTGGLLGWWVPAGALLRDCSSGEHTILIKQLLDPNPL